MKFTIWGDPHAQENNLDSIGQLFEHAESLGNPVLILGDLLHTKSIVRSPVLNYLIERISKSPLSFKILVGNHDYHNLECLKHSLEPLKFLPNVKIIDRPELAHLEDGMMLVMPYFHDFDTFRNVLKEKLEIAKKAEKVVRLLIMHQGVTGFDYGNGFIAERELELSDIAEFELVISGHFHKYQKRKNLIYLGTPFSHSQGEANQTKYIGILNTRSLKLELIETNFPKHITLEFDCSLALPNPTELMTDCRPDYNNVRIILTGPEEAINNFDKSAYTGIKFVERPTEVNTEKLVVSEEDSNEVKFSKWAKEVKNLDPETISLGLEILRGVK